MDGLEGCSLQQYLHNGLLGEQNESAWRRRGAGLAIFGKSATYPPARPDMRIDFQFDQAAFSFKALPFKIPCALHLLHKDTDG